MSADVFNPDVVPQELRALPQWVCWKYVTRSGKQTKCPFSSETGRRASSTSSSSWTSFEKALAAWSEADRYEGIGFVFTADDPFCGVDLDECVDENGNLVETAKQIVATFNSYTEISPSGRGVKIFIRARKPEGCRCKSKSIEGFKETEVYSDSRFFTVTGQHLQGTPASVESRQHELDELSARLWPQAKSKHSSSTSPSSTLHIDDDELIRHACNAKNGDRFQRLWSGDTSMHGDDFSAADQALTNHLAFWTGRDAERMDRMFRRSGLFREKWDEKRGTRTYGQMTIDRAISDCSEVFSPSSHHCNSTTNGYVESSNTNPPGVDGEHPSFIAPGQIDPATNRLVLATRRTLPTARAFVNQFHHHSDGRTLHHYAGQFFRWENNRFAEVEDAAMAARLLPWMHEAVQMVVNRKTGEVTAEPFPANPTTVNAALDSLRFHTHLPATTASPTWLNTRRDNPDPRELLPCQSFLLHLPTMERVRGSPAFFNINALDYDPDPNAPQPDAWLNFLTEVIEDDMQSLDLLQDWFGYSLTGDTSQQKMLLLVGPKRSGKGTIARVLTQLVGAGNVCGPTISSLAGNFGLQPLIGKSLAIVSDARFSGEHIATVVERLLCISGEDALTIDRKHTTSVTMKLPTRFMFLTNELPRFTDASGALAGRFVILRFTESFYGREDRTLTQRLLTELPGILNWAIEGWKRLNDRGYFVQPSSVEDAIQDLEDLSSPVGAFVRECCEVSPGLRTSVETMYNAWKAWCEREGRTKISTRQTFGRDLAASVPGVTCRRNHADGRFYEGIGLNTGA